MQRKKRAIFLECLTIREAIQYWRFWLLGIPFSIYTDHKPLENFKLNVRPDEELGDLLTQISQFNFKIIYNPGTNNAEADSLSRNPVLGPNPHQTKPILPTVNVLSLSEIIQDQSSFPHTGKYVKQNNILYKKHTKRILLTEQMGKILINKIHETLGHIGGKHLINSIRPHYFFPQLESHIAKVTATCEICIKNKTRVGKKLGLLKHLGPAARPFEILSLDTIGGFGGRRSTKRYLHLLVDHFTRFAYISTSANQNCSEFIKLLDSVQKQNKITTLLTDQYGAFMSNEFEKYIQQNSINHIFTAIDNPESNGLNERLNQTLTNRIRCKINIKNEKRAWSSIARECIDEYNNTIHTVTKFTPRFLMEGINFQIVPPELNNSPISLDEARKIALENSKENHKINKIRIDKNRKNYIFKKGDLVYVENGNKLNRKKLDEIRLGPFPITHLVSESILLVKCGNTRQHIRQFHINKVIPKIFNSDST